MNLDEIKNRLDIVEVVQKYVKLKRVGKYYSGLCPFHHETKPSFFVSPERQIFKCFGCGEGGNVINFLMKIENLSFKEVLEKIKEEYGLEIETQRKPEVSKKILEINYAALKFFRTKLQEFSFAKEYLIKRGLSEESIRFFEIGYSPGGTLMRDFLYAQGYSLEEIKKAGLLDEKNFDRFQSRIIFPLRNERGELIGFTGRIYPEKEKAPKYLNTPETEVFKKSEFLYGLFYAKEYIEKEKKAIVLEGQMDFLLSFQNGLKNVVSVSGSALTEAHLRKIRKYASLLVLAFDNDSAGFRAELRANLLAQKLDFKVFKLIYPEKDLGDFFKNKRSLEEIKEVYYLDFLFEKLKEIYGKENKKDFLETFLPQIKNLDLAEKDKYLTLLSQYLEIPKDFLSEELQKIQEIFFLTPEEEISKPVLPFEKNLSLKLVSLLFAFSLELEEEEFFPFLDEEVKGFYLRMKEGRLSEEEIDNLEIKKRFFEETGINPEKEIKKTLKELKKAFYKNKIEKLKEDLKFSQGELYDKIIEEINFCLKELKNLEKNA
jgi:DNA primase